MKKNFIFQLVVIASAILLLERCGQQTSATQSKPTADSAGGDAQYDSSTAKNNYGGFKSQVEWGAHIVAIGGCNDCHTPKKMTAMGPVPDMSLLLSGHPSKMPVPDVNRNEMESKGLAVTNDLTAWVGPWGVSYAANLTPDGTGIGNWEYPQFERAIREGKFMGSENGRQLLPPMPWQGLGKMTDGELKAVFAYLKSIKPVHNLVPDAEPPVSAQKH